MVYCSKNILYALIVCLGPITFGNICVYPSPTGTAIRTLHNLTDSSIEWSFYNGVTSLTAILGPLLNEFLFKIFKNSRKKTCFTISLITTIIWFLILVTKLSIWAGIAVRALLGVVLGSISSLSPMFLVELAPKGSSGLFGTLNQFSIVLSYCLLNVLGPHLDYIQMCYYSACFPFLQCILIWLVPETCQPPDDDEKYVKETIEKNLLKSSTINTLNNNNSISSSKANAVLISNNNFDDETKSTNSASSDINAPNFIINKKKLEKLCTKKNAFGLFVGIALMFFQQFSGISAFITNLTDMMKSSGLDINPSYQAGIVQLSQCIACIVSGVLVDKLGRKIAWVVSCFGSTFFLMLYSLNGLFNWSAFIPMISIFMFEFSFGIGLGPIPWFLIPEYFPPKVRSAATGICSSFNWFCSFGVIFLWPIMTKSIGTINSFFVFMAICFSALVFGVFFLRDPKPDTEGLELSVADLSIPLEMDMKTEKI